MDLNTCSVSESQILMVSTIKMKKHDSVNSEQAVAFCRIDVHSHDGHFWPQPMTESQLQSPLTTIVNLIARGCRYLFPASLRVQRNFLLASMHLYDGIFQVEQNLKLIMSSRVTCTQTRSWTHEGVAFHPAAPAQFGHYTSKIHNPWDRSFFL